MAQEEAGFGLVARRGVLLAATITGVAGLSGRSAATLPASPNGDDLLDKLRIADLVQRERAARDAGQWDEMTACWLPQATVEVSWFSGDASRFIAASRRNAASGRVSVHQLAPTVAVIAGERATAETPCELVSFVPVDGIDMCLTGIVRLLWRVERLDGRWLIAGLRMIYVRDYLVACDPGAVPTINRRELALHRPAYRFLSYTLARSPNRPRDDLPGIDRPDTVAAVRAAQELWLSSS